MNKLTSKSWYWILLIIAGLAVLWVPLPASASLPAERHFQVDAKRFEYSPEVLKVNLGDQVSIDLVATDVVHGLAVDGYNLEVKAEPGQTAHLTFIADQQGTFRFHCTVTCGNMHPFMTGKLEVGQNTLLWRSMALAGLAAIMAIWKAQK